MERRDFLKLAFGLTAGAATLAASAQAAPLLPQPLPESGPIAANEEARPAVITGEEVDRIKPEEVRWGHHGHHGGWHHHRRWHHRHWGWRHRHWRRHHRRHW